MGDTPLPISEDGVILRQSRAAQDGATRALALASWAGLALSGGAAWIIGGAILPAVIAATGFAALATFALRLPGRSARLCAALGLIGQAMVFTGSFTGQPWQIDTHMLFFAMLAAMVTMMDVGAILLAAAAVVLHHLVLTLAMPALIYPSTDLADNIGRTLMHGAIVIFEVAALVSAVRARLHLTQAAQQSMDEAEHLRSAAEAAQAEAEAATARARAAQKAAERSAQDLEQSQRHAAEEAQRSLALQSEARARAEEEAERRSREAASQKQVVEALRVALKAVSEGDLSQEITARFDPAYDELRRDFNAMVRALQETIASAHDHTGSIDGDTGAISQAAAQLSARTEQQAHHLEETASALDQIARAVASAAERAENARGKSEIAHEGAAEGRRVVDLAKETMGEISSSSERIFSITSVIDEISFQTNLLALNAGVEAARAGDAGRGFAVVASEVRALAQRSADAAKEINALIGDSARLVRKGVARVEETGEALANILEQMQQIAADVTEIAGATQAQSRSIAEANGAMRGLGQMSQQVVASFEETSAATSALKQETQALRQLLTRFQIPGTAPQPGRLRA